jgi:cytochrome c oxidase assembly protein subunit 15
MSDRAGRAVTTWLFVVCGLIMFMVVFGGYVRLTRSGLSIVEWNPISGVVPPIGQDAWEEEFAKYQQTPEFQKINSTMDLAAYRQIFYVEYFHRLIARLAGLVVVIPLFYFLFKGYIPWRKSGVYLFIAALFAFQGFLGWYMVSSGLVDNPAVSHYRLTLHLLVALFLLGLTYWMALRHVNRFPARIPGSGRSILFVLTGVMMILLLVQISYGGFMAGLKAGWISNTWPLMAGRWIPPNLLSNLEPWWANLVGAAPTVHFIHRWFAFAVLAIAILVYLVARRRHSPAQVARGAVWMIMLVVLQIALGISVVWFSVPTWLAITHQALAMGLFLINIYIGYHLLHEPAAEAVSLQRELKPAPV